MKFGITPGHNSAQAQVGYNLVELEAGDELETWDFAVINTLRRAAGFEEIEESAGDVIDQVESGDLDDAQLRVIAAVDQRQSVQKAVAEELEARAEAAAEPEEDES